MSKPRFRLTVWKPLRLQHPCCLPALEEEFSTGEGGGSANDLPRSFQTDELSEAIYQWHPGEIDVFAALDPAIAERLRVEIYEGFDPRLPPSTRSPRKLEVVVSSLEAALASSSSSAGSWAAVPDMPMEHEEFEDAIMAADVTMALLAHLRWVAEAFSGIPGSHIATR